MSDMGMGAISVLHVKFSRERGAEIDMKNRVPRSRCHPFSRS
jgi:hypothetical protein